MAAAAEPGSTPIADTDTDTDDDEADFDELDASALAASFQPTNDPEYDDARALVATVPVDELGELFTNAQGELERHFGEAAGTYDTAGAYTADHHQIIVRAAEIWRRVQAAGHAPHRGRPDHAAARRGDHTDVPDLP